ncbi:MAG: transglycosylase SLT domain-containing protein [Bacteroidia bacterium]|nr:transglycosylase SLT domain-containing protein [Bacteroidia bacterium]
MSAYKPYYPDVHSPDRAAASRHAATIVRPAPLGISLKMGHMALIAGFVLASNLLSHRLLNPSFAGWYEGADAHPSSELYLLDKASLFVPDPQGFEGKVREIAGMLDVPPEWLMAVMYSESRFDAAAVNLKGSGATGLIQFMPATATELNVSLERLRNMDPVHQLEYVYMYLQRVRERYGEFTTLVDLYLAILFPRGMNQDPCFTLYAHPTVAYQQNAGLDENKDSRVTVSDIDRRMQRLFPQAYMVEKNTPQP